MLLPVSFPHFLLKTCGHSCGKGLQPGLAHHFGPFCTHIVHVSCCFITDSYRVFVHKSLQGGKWTKHIVGNSERGPESGLPQRFPACQNRSAYSRNELRQPPSRSPTTSRHEDQGVLIAAPDNAPRPDSVSGLIAAPESGSAQSESICA